MQFLKQFLAFVFSRQMLAFLAMALLALAIWFVGPLLAVDGLRPLAAAGVRVALIVLLLVLGILWLASAPLSPVAVAALCLLLWQAGPLLDVGAARPLAPQWVRAMLIGTILLLYALYGLHRLWRALRNNEDLLAKLLNFGRDAGSDEAGKEEVRVLAAAVHRALAQLRKLRGRGGLRRLFEGKRHLYELPWYMILGSPGAGKTTALLNAGLQFPLARRMGHASRQAVSAAQGATLHCDWWFANEAVLIDTAGRYTTHGRKPAIDPIEWRGLLGLLRKHRTRAPLNGVIVALDASEILAMTEMARAEQAGMVRDRLAELRQELGIRFPVYVIVTKVDVLRGFGEYFQSLTSEGRTQAWGFTLPFQGMKNARATVQVREGLRAQVEAELGLLGERLADGLRARLNEEFDVERRRRLFALPRELAGLAAPLVPMLDEIFLVSRFDRTQLHDTLRGVYFTSGAQADAQVAADAGTLFQRLQRSLGSAPPVQQQRPAPGGRADGATPARGQQGFFLQDLLAKVIIPEAHLVRPNLRWEFRFRLLRLTGHALAVVIFAWLASALAVSFGNNREYLRTVGQRTDALAGQARALLDKFEPAGVPDLLNGARELPGHAGLDLDDPPGRFLYGLYAAPPVLAATAETYARLQDHTLLPILLRRMEAVLAQSVKDGDARTAYETLRVYKLLHDRDRYMKGGARDVRDWVLKDWERTDSAAAFGGRASMVGHATVLFSGERPVQSASLPNEGLVRAVQDFLGSNTSTQRVYERAKAAMLPEAPQEFTLVRAVGPQAGTVFSRAGGLPLEKGVPGLFTYDGYHDVFGKRLPEFVGRALDDDAWVMGRRGSPPLDAAARKRQDDPLLDDIRRQYLSEYAQQWEAFLGSIRTVGGGSDAAGTGLGFDLAVLRQFAAPDSPLARLARAAARETTLSRPLAVLRAQEEKGLLDRASDALDSRTGALGRSLGIRAEEQLEKQMVDNRFAALREVVTGQPDIDAGRMGGADAKPGLEAISGLVNEFYTLLVVADTALAAGSLPPGGAEVGARLKLEAGKLPAPFQEVLTALATSGGDKVVLGSTGILRNQAQQQLDRIMGLMAVQVGEPCRRGVEGRYPLAAVAQDASVEDFTQVFAAGGAADDFFTRYLASYVDTGVRPWRYKDPGAADAMAGAQGGAGDPASAQTSAGPTLRGELLKLLAQGGPDLESFHRARQIRDLFFRDAGGRKLAWKMDLRVLELEPSITDLVIDIDGQGQRYVHGPVQAFAVNWPGPRGGAMAEITANPRVSGPTSTLLASGPWALLRLLDKGRIVNTATPGRLSVEYSFDGRKALIDIDAGSQPHPLNSDLLKGFHCPGGAVRP